MLSPEKPTTKPNDFCKISYTNYELAQIKSQGSFINAPLICRLEIIMGPPVIWRCPYCRFAKMMISKLDQVMAENSKRTL
jgi:hypothetical protein